MRTIMRRSVVTADHPVLPYWAEAVQFALAGAFDPVPGAALPPPAARFVRISGCTLPFIGFAYE